MINIYTANGKKTHWATGSVWPDHCVWLDMIAPTDEEIAQVQTDFKVILPHGDDISEIQISSQLYAEGDEYVMTMPIMARTDQAYDYEIGPMSFVLSPRILITLRYLNPKSISLFCEKFQQKSVDYATPAKVMVGLLDMFVDRSTEILEQVGDKIDALSQDIFNGSSRQEKDIRLDKSSHVRRVLQDVGRTGDLLGKFRNVMAGSERVILFLANNAEIILGEKGVHRSKSLASDIQSLELHVDSLQQRVEFLLDATLGMISIEQNKVMQIFTVAAVTLMPPTLIAGIYGMNFHDMPELSWHFGYPLSILLILASALLPLLYFRHKGWV